MKKLLLLISFFTMAQSSISQAEGYGPYPAELPCLYGQSSRPECPKSTDRSGGGNG